MRRQRVRSTNECVGIRDLCVGYVRKGSRHPYKCLVVLSVALFSQAVCPASGLLMTPSGNLDLMFGSAGVVTVDFNGANDRANAIAIQSDGKVILGGFATAAGSSFDQFALVRLNVDGTLDSSFGSGGKATTDFGPLTNEVTGIAIQGDGKIVAVGFVQTPGRGYDFGLARFNSDGTLDTSFGSGGKVATDISGASDFAHSVVLQPDGKIVVGGSTQTVRSFDFAVARYKPDGSLDRRFGTGGISTVDFGREDEVLAIALQPDGKIVAAGYAGRPGALEDFGLARFNTDGSLDTSFGASGKLTTDFGFRDKAMGVLILPNGQIVAAGYAGDSTDLNYGFALARYSSDGLLDSTFGVNGAVITHFSGRIDEAHALALDADGGLVVVGESGGNLAVARYDIAGNLDATFGSNGFIGSPFPTSQGTLGSAVAIQKTGTIFAAGWAFDILGSYDFAVAAFENIPQISNASLDGKNLLVSGRNFGIGAVILVDGTARRTISDSQNPRSLLVGKKVGKSIGAGQTVMLQVQNPSGVVSLPFPFMRPD
jgi:uncharacterized delta-60 repeat protein